MPVDSSLRNVEAHVTGWSLGIPRDPSRPLYASTVADNLFLKGVTGRTEQEFRRADGSELRDTDKRPAKMRAFMSSSALAVNFFDAWRGAPSPLGTALGFDCPVSDLRFEYVCSSYPVGPRSPNLDLLLTLANGSAVCVESKFTEPYRRPGRKRLASKYFSVAPSGYWSAVGLVKVQSLADGLREGRWSYLDVAQLLKHMLGLAHDGCASSLLYLWYDTGLDDAEAHRDEIARFASHVEGESIAFRSRTYQEAFAVLRTADEPTPGWRDYMADRYFAA